MKFTNQQIKKIAEWLNIPMHGDQARHRNQFFNLIKNHLDIVEKKRLDIASSFAEKDEKGQPKTENGVFKISADDQKKASDTYSTFLNEETTFDIPKPLARSVGQMLKGSTQGLSIIDGAIYDDVLTTIEQV